MSMIFDEPMSAPSLLELPVAQTTKHYSFVVVCCSGVRKEFACDAEDFVAARKLLADFAREN